MYHNSEFKDFSGLITSIADADSIEKFKSDVPK